MTERLREELRRLGDEAPDLKIPTGTWERGRRARTRDRLATGAAVLVLVALAGALVRVTPAQRLSTEVFTGTGDAHTSPGVPDHLWAPPATGVEVTDELAVGRVSAAFLDGFSPHRRLFLVTASEGDYVQVRLPGYPPQENFAFAAPQVSPDGSRLAYPFVEDADASGRRPTGIRVVALGSGQVTEFAAEYGEGVVMTSLAWSPDGRWLVWAGAVTRRWGDSGWSSKGTAVGRIDVIDGSSSRVRLGPARAGLLAIDRDGVVSSLDVTGRGAFLSHSDGRPVRAPFAGLTNVVADSTPFWSPSGRAVSVTTSSPVNEIPVHGTQEAVALPRTRYPDGAIVTPLGWLDEEHLVVTANRVSPRDGDGAFGTGSADLLVLRRGAAASVTTIGTVDVGVDAVSLATGLMSIERPTVERPDPPWVPDTQLRWGLTGLILLAAVATAYLLYRRPPRAR